VDAPYRHIACCIDDSDASQRALAHARVLQALGPGRLSLVHAVQLPLPYSSGFGTWIPNPADLVDAARRWMEEATADVPEGESVILEGYPAAVVCEWAAEQAVDLLVCAAHRSLAQRLALGSFAHYLVSHAPCPVLVLRPPAAPRRD
jgi:nucleotide-binding universal stress UspA family protein